MRCYNLIVTTWIRQPHAPRVKRWTKGEYIRLMECGAFAEDADFYLFRGELIEMSPMQTPHAMSITRCTKLLFSLFDPTAFDIRVQLPFDVPGDSMPEPDLLVCTIEQGQRKPHPSQALLVIEIAESSLWHDRDKALEYAAAGVPDYWLINLNARNVEVFRKPVTDSNTDLGYRYEEHRVLQTNEMISPLVLPHRSLNVASFL